MHSTEEGPVSRWQVKRDVSIADILSFVSAAVAVLYAYTTLDKRITVIETAMLEFKAAEKKRDDDLVRLQARIDVRLDRLDEKLDRLLQRDDKVAR